ncbi:hypothetical protein Vafri_15027 [Volvox africanus]|nr:hypothetical protein Vafri_15027 [Volvox africanus]
MLEVTAHAEGARTQRGACSVISSRICRCCKNGPCWGAGDMKETVGTQIGVDRQEPPSWQCTGGTEQQGFRPRTCVGGGGGSGGWAARWTGRASGHGGCSGGDSLKAWTREGHLSSARGWGEAAAAAAASSAAAACSTQLLPVWGTFATIQTDLHNPVLRTILSMGVELRTRWLHRPYGDQALFIRRDVLEAQSGFKEWPLLEDLEMVERLSKEQPPVIVDAPLFTSGRRWQSVGFIRTTLINQVILICYAFGVSPDMLAEWYRHAKGFGAVTRPQ